MPGLNSQGTCEKAVVATAAKAAAAISVLESVLMGGFLSIDVNARQSGADLIRGRIAPIRKCRCPIGSIATAYRAPIARRYRLESEAAFHIGGSCRHPALRSPTEGTRQRTGDVP